MKTTLQKLFSPVLDYFESIEGEYSYKPSHRTILITIGLLFLLLSSAVLAGAIFTAQMVALFPFLIFFSASAVCLIVGLLGSDKAVAKLWRNKD